MSTTVVIGGLLLAAGFSSVRWIGASAVLGAIVYLGAWRNATLIPVSKDDGRQARRHGWLLVLAVASVVLATLAWQAVRGD